MFLCIKKFIYKFNRLHLKIKGLESRNNEVYILFKYNHIRGNIYKLELYKKINGQKYEIKADFKNDTWEINSQKISPIKNNKDYITLIDFLNLTKIKFR